MAEINFKIMETPEPTSTGPTPTPTGAMSNLGCSQLGEYCFYDILNGKPSYKHKDVDSYIYWKQDFWNIGADRSLKGHVAVSSSDNEPPTIGWKNVTGAVNPEGAFTLLPDTNNSLILTSMSECPLPTPTATVPAPGTTYSPTSTPTATPTGTPTPTPAPTSTEPPPGFTYSPTSTPTSTPTPTSTHIPAGYIVDGPCLNLRCCGSTGTGGEVHLWWDGFDVTSNKLADVMTLGGAYIMFDDNLVLTPQVSDGKKVDHYAIEWIEIHQNDSVHAIISERSQICQYPGSTIASNFFVIGNPIGAVNQATCKTISQDCKDESGNGCSYTADWCTYRISYIPNRFSKFKYFGGLNWEAMKYIASLSISTSGTNGPMGTNISYYNGPHFRIPGDSFTGISGAYNTSALDSGNGFNVFSKIVENSIILENLRATGQMNMAAVITARIALLVPPAGGGSSDPCCQASDWEIMNGNCPKDPTNDWWIVPDCNCDRFAEDPGYGAGGPFGTELECYRNTSCGSSFRCVDGACKETYFGYYSSMVDCLLNCPIPQPTPTSTAPPPTSPPAPKWYFDECSGGQASCVQGTPPFLGSALYDSEPECEGDNASQCESDCGDCRYTYNNDIDQWQFSSDNCGAGCSCPSESDVNSNPGSSGGCEDQPTCTSCSAPCVPDTPDPTSDPCSNCPETIWGDWEYAYPRPGTDDKKCVRTGCTTNCPSTGDCSCVEIVVEFSNDEDCPYSSFTFTSKESIEW